MIDKSALKFQENLSAAETNHMVVTGNVAIVTRCNYHMTVLSLDLHVFNLEFFRSIYLFFFLLSSLI